ncbi:MAG TPA: N-acetylornithine carbamoyltransferase [Pyrinomonadaceae bacterium]|jgi:N-acetylornithine carbamoyltransferase|nr:N-acetylornithine carbamoyltransferase [Pyrinomonadaceae bacterium]
MPEDFLTTADWTRAELELLIDAAQRFKRGEQRSRALAGRSVALVFFNPSLRTRASMQVGVYELGGNAVVLEPGGTSWTLEHAEGVVMDGDKTEHVTEFVRVLGRYCAAIGVRSFAALKDWEEERRDPVLQAFARHSPVPVINLESAMHHPCQAMADMMTLRERLGEGRKRVVLTWAWHPKALPMAVPNSFALAAAQMGHEVTVAQPDGYELDEELMRSVKQRAEESGGSLRFTNEMDEAFDGAEAIYAKSWGSLKFYGAPEKEQQVRASLRRDRWIVDERRMARTSNGIFMHCLPVRRNVIVTDGVLDSDRSVVIDEAENRLHVQKAIMARLLGGETG